MSYRFKELFLSFTIVAMLLFSAVGTTTVYADDGPATGTPVGTETTVTSTDGQPPVTGTETPPPTETPVTDPAAPVTDPASVDPGTPTDPAAVAPVTEVASPEVAATDTPVTPILEQLPENTTVTVIDAAGVAQPLASQASADAIATTTDPIWCPAGQPPTPGANGCTDSFNSFDELLTFLKTNEGDVAYQQAGAIYVQKDQYVTSETSIDFNNYGFSTINNYDLTLQGGWNTADNTVNPADTTQFTVPIIIGSSANPWVGALTINNISISGVSGQSGLTLVNQGNVNLSNVAVTNSQAGADIQTTGAVQVTDSSFNGNADHGIQIDTNREVSLVNVKADHNLVFGAHIKAGDVAIDTASFSNNGSGGGLDVTSQSAIALFGVNANNNQQFGANIFAGDLVAVAQSNFNDNGGYGLNVITPSLIAVENVNANNNALYGAYLEGSDTVVNNSFFTANGSLGVVSEPVGYGLKIVSTGTVNLTDINAADSVGNQLFGADITAAKDVNISNAFFSGQHSEISKPSNGLPTTYYGYGLNVVTPANIFLDYVVGNDNNLWGGKLTGNNITVYNSQFNNNVTDSTLFIDDTGLLVDAKGYVDIYKTEAKENRLIGATITAVGNVFVASSNFSDNRGITIFCHDGTCEDLHVYGYGLNVSTSANIFVSGTTANNNYLFGATLSGANVEITNSTFDFNGSCFDRPGVSSLVANCTDPFGIDPIGQGLIVNSSGDTSLVNVSASNNELLGASVQAVGNVTVTASIFSGNKSYTYFNNGDINTNGNGLIVVANGDILLNADANSVGNTASDNGENGAILTGYSLITVSDSIFNNNGNTGGNNDLAITQLGGDVTLNNVTASNNPAQDGVNVTGACGKTVYVNGGTFTNNDRFGIKVKLSTLVLDGTQTFANNVEGNVFTTTDTCPPVVNTSSNTSNTGTGSNNSTTPPNTDPNNTPVVDNNNTTPPNTDSNNAPVDDNNNTTPPNTDSNNAPVGGNDDITPTNTNTDLDNNTPEDTNNTTVGSNNGTTTIIINTHTDTDNKTSRDKTTHIQMRVLGGKFHIGKGFHYNKPWWTTTTTLKHSIPTGAKCKGG